MNNIENILSEYKSLNLSQVIDHDKFNQYAIVHHSTTIEGATLTEVETRLLLDEGLTPKGKPLLHSLMVQDHYEAILFVIQNAKYPSVISPTLIQQINSKVMKQTGRVYQTVFGEIDAAKVMFRKGNVSAGNSYFVNYTKVEELVNELCNRINEKLESITDVVDKLNLSFDAHFNLVTIHPFYDGNGRTSRLLMNYIQLLFDLPMAIVFKEDKADYFEALQATRQKEDIQIFRSFMYDQYAKLLQGEIAAFKKMNSSGAKGSSGFSLVF